MNSNNNIFSFTKNFNGNPKDWTRFKREFNSIVNANGESMFQPYIFYLVPHQQGKVALYTDCSWFLSADGEREMKANRVSSGDSVWFLPECVGEILIS